MLFNYITFATRASAMLSMGRDEMRFPKWLGRPYYIRGYNRDDLSAAQCSGIPTDNGAAVQYASRRSAAAWRS